MSAHAMHAARYKRTLTAELLLVTEIQLLILLTKWPLDADVVLLLDGALLLLGTLATAFFLARRTGGWFVLCGVVPIVASLTQLFWSFGAEKTFLVFITILLLADMAANLILLAISLWKSSRGRGMGWPG